MIDNSAPATGLTSSNVESSLLTEEVNKESLDNTCSSTALVVRERSKEKKKEKSMGKLRSKSCGGHNVKDLEYYHYGKNGYLKRDYR